MKRKTAGILLGITCSAMLLTGCGSTPSAAQAAEESEDTDQEGTGGNQSGGTEVNGTVEETASEVQAAETVPENTASVRAAAAICLRDDQSEEDKKDGEWLKEGFAGINCETFLSFAENDADRQVQQIREMIRQEPQILVIKPVDPYQLTEVVAEAKEKGITVFSYDDLIMQSSALSYYVTFDMREIGHQIARRMIEKKDLKKLQSEGLQATMELFMGPGDCLQTLFLFNGILEELQPYLDDGTLICPSKEMDFLETVSEMDREGAVKERFRRMLSEAYTAGDCPDLIFTSYDGAVEEILEELDAAEILPGTESFPLINGMGCEVDVIRAIAEGRVSFDVYMDRKNLADLCVSMADLIISGETPEVNNYEQYDNGIRLIHTNTVSSDLMDSDNYEMLIDIGIYTEEEVAPVYETMTQDFLFSLPEKQEPQEDPSPKGTAEGRPSGKFGISKEENETDGNLYRNIM